MVDATLADKNSLNQQIVFAEYEIANNGAGNARGQFKKQTFIVQTALSYTVSVWNRCRAGLNLSALRFQKVTRRSMRHAPPLGGGMNPHKTKRRP